MYIQESITKSRLGWTSRLSNAFLSSSLRGFTLALLIAILTLCLWPPYIAQAKDAVGPFDGSFALSQSEALAKFTDDESSTSRIEATENGVLLHSPLQDLAGALSTDGLWLYSTDGGDQTESFRVMATAIGRDLDDAVSLVETGTVEADAQLARFVRPLLIEEYSVSMDGVRQDFLALKRPAGADPLLVELTIDGAQVEASTDGVTLMLDDTSRRLSYSRLYVSDANGQRLDAYMKVLDARRMAIVVDDSNAVWPLRIDPTISDANWVSMTSIGLSGNGFIQEMAVLGGDLYVGGFFTATEGVSASGLAKWDGSSWSDLGSGALGTGEFGQPSQVLDLFVNNNKLYVSGYLYLPGQTGDALPIAIWDGNQWLDSGPDSLDPSSGVFAIAASDDDLYAGGLIQLPVTAGNPTSTFIAHWDGNGWTALDSGNTDVMPVFVQDMVIRGGNLYIGGLRFSVSGSSLYKWDGSALSAIGDDIEGSTEMAVGGDNLYFNRSVVDPNLGSSHYSVMKLDSNDSLTSLIADISGEVADLAVSGDDLYVGGYFTTTNGIATNGVAKWDGSEWSALGSGVDGVVGAMAATETELIVSGAFTTAGGKHSPDLALALLSVLADDDAASATQGISTTIDVLSNDAPATGPMLSVVGQPQNGQAQISGNTVVYTPSLNFVGVDTFTYTANLLDLSDAATVYVVVNAADEEESPVVEVESVDSESGGQLAAPGLTVDIEGDDVSGDVTLLYEEVAPEEVGAPPADFQLGNLVFNLDAILGGAVQDEYNFDNPVTFEYEYTDEDVAGLDESTLELLFWDEDSGSWLGGAENGIVCEPVDLENNRLICEVSHLTPFAIMSGPASGDGVLGGSVWNDIDGINGQNGMEPWLADAELFVRRAGDDGTLNTADDEILPNAVVDASGRYTVENLPADDYLLTFDVLSVPIGLEPVSGNDRMTVTLGASEVRSDLDIPLTYIGKAAVGNYVWEDENGNGDFSDTGEGEFDGGIDGVTMMLWLEQANAGTIDPADDLLLDITTTGNDASTTGTTETGWYQFEVAADGVQNFWVSVGGTNFDPSGALDGYTQTNGSDGRTLLPALSAGGDDTVDFGYAQTGDIGDFVWYDTDGDGEQDTGEPGIPSTVVSLTLRSGTVITTETDANGLYSFDDRLPGDYTVTVGNGVPVNAVNTTGADSQSSPYALTLSSGQDVDDADFGYDVPTSYVITHTNEVINEARAGEDMVFTVVVTNTGGSWITSLPVRYYYDNRVMRFESSTPAPDVDADDGELDWIDLLSVSNPLAPGDSIQIVLTFKALRDPGTLNGNSTTNTVEVLDGWADPDGPQTVSSASVAMAAMITGGPLGSIEPVDGNEGSGVGSDVMILASTGVEMAQSSVTQTEAGTLIRWTTNNELRVSGFHILRETNGHMTQVNGEMVVAQSSGQVAGGSYEIVDTNSTADATYWLDVEGIDGSAERLRLGFANATGRVGIFLPLITR